MKYHCGFLNSVLSTKFQNLTLTNIFSLWVYWCFNAKSKSIKKQNFYSTQVVLYLLNFLSKTVMVAAEKYKEKVEANCTGFSAEFFGSQSVEMFGFARKTKIQILTTSCLSLTKIHQLLLKSLGLYTIQPFFLKIAIKRNKMQALFFLSLLSALGAFLFFNLHLVLTDLISKHA